MARDLLPALQLSEIERTVTKYPDGVALYNSCLTFEASKSFQAFTYKVIISATETIAITMAKEKITTGADYNSNSGSKSSNNDCKGNNNSITSDENISFYSNIDSNTHLSSNNNSDR